MVEIGQKIFEDRYEIFGYLGRGGFGTVYKAFQLYDQAKTVAIKFLQGHSDAYAQAFDSLRQEVLVLDKLSNSNVVKIIALEKDEKHMAIVMEYLAGFSLSQLIRGAGKNSQNPQFIGPETVANIGARLASGLEFIHRQGVIHGDIKPSNIIFRDKTISTPVLVDFAHGILEENEEIKNSRNGQAVTLTYLPPERTGFLKETGDRRSDLYSLGICLYELASGSPPYHSSDRKNMINLIMSEVPRPLPKVVKNFPVPLWDVIQRLLRKNPGDRYQTAMGAYWDLKNCTDILNNGKKLKSFALGRKDQLRELNYKVPMVGRKEELSYLKKSFEKSLSGIPQSCLIGAPSGLGKSRLATEVTIQAKNKNYRVLYAKFSKFETNLPLAAIVHACIDHAEYISQQGENTVKEWRNSLVSQLGSSGNLIKDRLHQFGINLPDFPPMKPLSPEEESALLSKTIAEFMSIEDGNSNGTLIFLDDLQWADRKSSEVIAELTAICRSTLTKNLFFLGTYRSNEVNKDSILNTRILSNLNHDNCRLIELGPLSESESGKLVSRLLDEDNEQIEKLKPCIYESAKGNPFYTYEILKMLISKEIYHPTADGSTWVFDEAKSNKINFETELSGLVKERINQLSTAGSKLIRFSSIAGNTISNGLLELIWTHRGDTPKENIDSRKEALKELNLAREELLQNHFITDTQNGVAFFHDKVREAAYAMTDNKDRAEIHDVIGTYRSYEILRRKNLDETPSKDFFETAFHIVNSKKPSDPTTSRKVLYLAAQKAIKVFAYTKAQEYLKKASEFFDKPLGENTLKEWIQVHELLADTLAVSESIDLALKIYDEVLEKAKDPIQVANIYSKKAECNLSLFRYKESLESAHLGLNIFKLHLVTDEKMSFVRTFLMLPFFLVFIGFYHLVGKYIPKKELKSVAKLTQSRLWANVLPPAFFTKPITAIEMLIPLTMKYLFYKPNEYRQILIGYWGVACGAFGLSKLSNLFFTEAYRYFDQNPNPISKGFLSMTWGYLNHFPSGEVSKAQERMSEALELLEGVGEKFWCYLTLQGMAHLDWYGLCNDKAKKYIPRAVYVWEKTQFEPSAMGSAARQAFLSKDINRMGYWLKTVEQAALNIEKQGFETIDSVYANLAPGEVYYLSKDYERAYPLLRKAFYITKSHFHRVAYCNYAPVLFSRCALKMGRRDEALKSLLFSWFNVLTGIKVYLPQTLYATGEWFYHSGYLRTGLKIIQYGLQIARSRNYDSIEAEGKQLLGELYLKSNSDMAEYYFQSARKTFKQLNYKSLVDQCDAELNEISSMQQAQQIPVETTMKSTNFREEIETKALLEIFLKLSSLKDKDHLLDGIMEALCSCTGSESAVVFLNSKDGWNIEAARNIDIKQLKTDRYSFCGIDKIFLDAYLKTNLMEPKVRHKKGGDLPISVEVDGSAMIVPLALGKDVYGICYLANRHIEDIFDSRSIDIAKPIAAQAVIGLQNISVLNQTKQKAKIEADFLAASSIQETLLANRAVVPGLATSYFYKSADHTGGDWFGYYYDKVKNICFIGVGDVAGHGVPAAIVTGVATGAIEAIIDQQFTTNYKPDETIQEIFTRVNTALYHTGRRNGKTMAMTLLALDLENGDIWYGNAGHTPPLHLTSEAARKKNSVGRLLGFGPSSGTWNINKAKINLNENLILYTDGLFENEGPEGEVLRSTYLLKHLPQFANETAESILDFIIKEGHRRWKDHPPADDCTVLVLKWAGKRVMEKAIDEAS